MKYLAGLLNRVCIAVLLFSVLPLSNFGQTVLSKVLPSIEINNQRLDNALEIISNQGNFYFSYNSNIIKRDSLIALTAYNKTVKQVLDFIFHGTIEYKESGNYIILRRVPLTLSLITNQAVTEDKMYTVSGYVLDEQTGEKISNASIYEKQRLVSTLTNEQGFFKIRLKSNSGKAALTVSKEFYQDTTVIIQPKYNQQVTITILPLEFSGKMITVSPTDFLMPDSIAIDVEIDSNITRYVYLKIDSFKVEKTAVGNLLLSSRLKVQSLNLKKFFTERPFQLSFTPGLSTHGRMSAQVVNNLSFNILGGYSGGVNGLELGGLFNIDKKNVQYLQIAGLFNTVGGQVKGLQIGGLHNTVLNRMEGLQIAGINNIVKKRFTGIQIAGIYNHVNDSMTGLQLAGISNFARKRTTGLQIAGIANISIREMKGVQVGGVFNYARKLKGVQVGLINISDTSDGYSIGLINIVLKGYHKLSFSANEVFSLHAAFKTGNSRLYSILLAGMKVETRDTIFSFGYGIGTEIPFSKRLALNPEITSQYLYLGSWNYLNLLNKVHFNLTLKFGKYFSVFAGPSFAVYYAGQPYGVDGNHFSVPLARYHTYNLGGTVIGWFGWNAGINFF